MTISPSSPPPAGLRWADTRGMRAVTTILACLALLAAIALGIRQQIYISCIGDSSKISSNRTGVIARATDNERRAQRLLIANADPANIAGLKAAVLDAYDATDRVRAANQPVPVDCG